MYQRLSVWMFVFAFATLGVLRAQSPAAATEPPAAKTGMVSAQIIAAKVTGSVSMLLSGTTTPVKDGDKISESATVITANESSVILVFSNGATTQLGADTTLVIEQFLQDPFSAEIKVAERDSEPTTSQTKLNLTKGELIGKVVHLNHEKGSTFTVQTPVGAAGIRGTTFRIVFRPSGTGQAFAVFSLSTVEGNVNFQQGAAGGTPGTPQGQPQGQGTPGATPGEGGTPAEGGAPGAGQPSSSSGGVPVITGQEVVVTVSVDVNPQTGQVTVTAPPTVTSTVPISTQKQADIVQQAQTMAVAAASTTFTPTTPTTSTTPTTPTTDQGQQSGTDTGGTTPPADSGSTPPAGSGTTGGSGSGNTGSGGDTSTPKPTYTPPAPPPTTPIPATTPGGGRPG